MDKIQEVMRKLQEKRKQQTLLIPDQEKIVVVAEENFKDQDIFEDLADE